MAFKPVSRHAGPIRAGANRMDVSHKPRKGWCAPVGLSIQGVA